MSNPMSSRKSLKPLPRLESDEEAERFVESADLSNHDLSGFRPARFSFATIELPKKRVRAVAATRMGALHEPLNGLLDPE